MSIDVEESVRTFMTACGQGRDDGKHAFDLRLKLIEEEYLEFLEALKWGDNVFVAKEAADLVYVVVGTCIARGIPFNQVFAALQISNMSKIGPDGTIQFREDGKVLKGPDYQNAEDTIREILR